MKILFNIYFINVDGERDGKSTAEELSPFHFMSLEYEVALNETPLRVSTDSNVFEGDIERDDEEDLRCFNESFSDVTSTKNQVELDVIEDGYFCDSFKNWSWNWGAININILYHSNYTHQLYMIKVITQNMLEEYK